MTNKTLKNFSEQTSHLVRLADQMRDAALTIDNVASSGAIAFPADSIQRRILRLKEIRNHRLTRSEFFEDDLFADPAWDILLFLMLNNLEQRRVKTNTVCLESRVPATTALRWIRLLVKKGLVVQQHDHLDRRLVFLELSSEGIAKMDAYLDAVSSQPLTADRMREHAV